MVAATDSEDSSLQVGPPRQAASPQPTSPSGVSRRTKTKFIVSRVVKDILWGRSTGMSAWITRTSAIFIVPHYPCCEQSRQARSRSPAEGSRVRSSTAQHWHALLDHPIRPRQHRGRDREPERLRSLEVDHQLELVGLLDRQVRRLGPFEDLVHIRSGPAE